MGLALLFSGCAASRVPVAQKRHGLWRDRAQAPRPTYIFGDRWIRNDGISKVIRVESDHYVFSASTGMELHLTKDLALAHYRHGRAELQFAPAPKIDWPLTVGSARGGDGEQTLYGEPYAADLHWAVEAYEDVTSPCWDIQGVPHRVHSNAATDDRLRASAGNRPAD